MLFVGLQDVPLCAAREADEIDAARMPFGEAACKSSLRQMVDCSHLDAVDKHETGEFLKGVDFPEEERSFLLVAEMATDADVEVAGAGDVDTHCHQLGAGVAGISIALDVAAARALCRLQRGDREASLLWRVRLAEVSVEEDLSLHRIRSLRGGD